MAKKSLKNALELALSDGEANFQQTARAVVTRQVNQPNSKEAGDSDLNEKALTKEKSIYLDTPKDIDLNKDLIKDIDKDKPIPKDIPKDISVIEKKEKQTPKELNQDDKVRDNNKAISLDKANDIVKNKSNKPELVIEEVIKFRDFNQSTSFVVRRDIIDLINELQEEAKRKGRKKGFVADFVNAAFLAHLKRYGLELPEVATTAYMKQYLKEKH